MKLFVWQSRQLAIAAALALIIAAGLLLPLRGTIDNTNTALLLTIPVLAISIFGRRWAVLIAAASAAIAFDFFHTLPYYQLTMRHGADILTASLLLMVGLISGELALRARRHQSTSRLHARDIARIHAIAELVASGEPSEFVVITVAKELREVLHVDDVQFEPAPVSTRTAQLATLDQLVPFRHHAPGHVTAPTQVAVPITTSSHTWGAYILTANAGIVTANAPRAVALTLTHQVAIAIAAAAASPSR
jgi:K+-sensing histidine kinase KdpD